MALAKGTANPLNLAGQRKLPYIPVHFSRLVCPSMSLTRSNIDNVDRWIYNNLNSRYSIVTKQILDSNRKIIECFEIGVEDPAELTMLSLACPYIQPKQEIK